MNIALFGFMGVGKTVVGQALAHRLGLNFVDLDELIVERTGKPISEIFKEKGEAEFRRIEKRITEEIAAKDNQVIACGGGTVLDDENVVRLRKSSKLIFLTADVETIIDRTKDDEGVRPLINVEDRVKEIRNLLDQRYNKYLEAADLVVETSYGNPDEIAMEIEETLEKLGNNDYKSIN